MLHVRLRLAVLTVLAILVATATAVVALASLYHVGMVREGEGLARMVQSQATLAQAVFDAHLELSEGDTAAALAETMTHLERALGAVRDLGGFAGFAVSHRSGDTLLVELKLAVDTVLAHDTIILPSPRMLIAERAVAGEAAVVRGERDHRGVPVLAAYAPVPGTGLGLIAKVDLAEARAPYVTSGIVAGLVAVLFMVLALLVARRVSAPVVSEVEEREAAHQALVANVPGILFLIHSEGAEGWSIQILEGAVEEITGFSREHFTSRTRAWLDLVHPEDRPAAWARWGAYAAGEEVEGPWDYRIVRADGTVVWVRARARLRRGTDRGGGGAAVAGVLVDVTAEHRAREVRERAEEDLATLVERLPGSAVLVLDADLRVLFCGGEVLERLGAGSGQLKGLSLGEFVPEEVLERARSARDSALRGEPHHYEESIAGRTLLVNASPLVGPGGSVERLLVLATDVTDERDSAEALAASEQRLRLALAGGRHGLYDLDLRTGHAVVNDEYAKMMGYDPATFVETNAAWRERLHPEDRDAVYAEYEAYVRGERPVYRVEFRQRTADGGWKWILSLGEIVERDGDGRPTRMIGTHTDIHERKEAEEALRVHRDELRRWQGVMLDREDRIQELKREVNALCRRSGEALRYPSQEGGARV